MANFEKEKKQQYSHILLVLLPVMFRLLYSFTSITLNKKLFDLKQTDSELDIIIYIKKKNRSTNKTKKLQLFEIAAKVLNNNLM